MRSRKKTLILTLDAFETIFVPRHPVANQYVDGARKFNLPFPNNAVEKVQSAFKTTFKTLSSQRPNYGREAALRGEYGGPRQWWEEAIRGSLGRGLVADHDEEGRARAREQEIPQELVEYLLNRFASKKAYTLYDDVDHFLHWTERLKLRCGGKPHDDYAPFDTVLLGVLSNSDDRVPVILQSLGLRVGPARAVAAAAGAPAPPAESPPPPGLPGFEDVREPLPARDDAAPSFDPEIPPRLRQAFPYQLDFVVTSYQAGAEKPSPAIFDAAKKTALGLVGTGRGDDDECVCVHVGDDYQKDYRAAVDAGWDAFFLDRPGNGSVGDADGKRIRSLVELTRKLDDYIYR